MSIAKFAAATAVAALMATGASAATFGSIPGTGVGDTTNEGLGPLFGQTARNGYFGATLYYVGTGTITIDYLGSEAGNVNSFTWDGLGTLSTPGGSNHWNVAGFSSLGPVAASWGQLGFSFGIPGDSVANGSNPDGSGGGNAGNTPNFFVSFDNENASGGMIAYLFLDDGGASFDDNHDDMVIRLTASGGSINIAPVPLPAAGFLLLGGLGALGAVARRRKSA